MAQAKWRMNCKPTLCDGSSGLGLAPTQDIIRYILSFLRIGILDATGVS